MSDSDAILLVEGSTDKEYFTLLRGAGHGSNRLDFRGEIVSYEGKDSLKNTVLLNFIRNRYRRIFVTFDLDAREELVGRLESLGFEPERHFAAVGVDAAGKKNIEGLLPDSIQRAVYSANPELVQAAMHGNRKEQKSAKGELKRLQLREFKAKAKPGTEYYGGLYKVGGMVNKALGGSDSDEERCGA